jgi:Spy/CpxP family protein refolding chaperone
MKRIPLSLTAAGAALAVFVAVPALSTSAALQAQSTATPAPPAAQAPAPTVPTELKPLFAGVTLTEAQIKQVVGIHQKYPAPTAAQPDSAQPGMGAGAADRSADEAKELRTILTPNQQKVFDKNQAQVKATWKKPGY